MYGRVSMVLTVPIASYIISEPGIETLTAGSTAGTIHDNQSVHAVGLLRVRLRGVPCDLRETPPWLLATLSARPWSSSRRTTDRSVASIDDADVVLVFTRRLNTGRPGAGAVQSVLRRWTPHSRGADSQPWLPELAGVRCGGAGRELRQCTTARGRWCGSTRCRVLPAIQSSTECRGSCPTAACTGIRRSRTDATLLLTGTTHEATEPVAWTRMNAGGRVFYTSLGHQDDFRAGRVSPPADQRRALGRGGRLI